MVFIVGVDHLVQYRGPCPEPVRQEFRELLIDLAAELEISLIAEEFSEESLSEVYGSAESTARATAEECGIGHLFCDPEEDDRRSLGIPYWADLKERVKETRGLFAKIIIDEKIRRLVDQETAELDRSFWEIRENFWLEKISDKLSENILFVCGHEHADRFQNLLAGKGIQSKVVNRFWRENLFRDYSSLGLA